MKKSQKFYLPLKRLIGFCGSFVGIIVCSLLLWWWVFPINLIVTKGHPLFIQERYGKNQRVFKLIKFRSMKMSANPNLAPSDMDDKTQDDMDTKFGKFLRKTSIDETPQLLNIFVGQMAFIGPRPGSAHNEEYLRDCRLKYTPNAFDVRPGLGGYAQAKMKREHNPELKAEFDHRYVEKMSLWLDIKIFVLTVFGVCFDVLMGISRKLRWGSFHLFYAFLDFGMSFGIVLLSMLAYYGYQGFADNIVAIMIYAGSISLGTILFFLIFRVYKIITLDIGMFETVRIILATFFVHVIGMIAIIFVPQLPDAGIYVYNWILTTIALMFLHSVLRVNIRLINLLLSATQKDKSVRTLVIGAGATGKIVADESRRNRNNHNYIVSFIDDDQSKIGGLFANIPVRGPISNIASIIESTKADEVIIAMSEISKERLHEILSLLNSSPVRVRRMPLISEMEGPNDKRIIDVDLDDLLSRDAVILDNTATKEMLNGKCVMVTGAGGSIGSELVRQIFKTHPKTLILFDIYENTTYDIQMELVRLMREEKIADIDLVTLIGSTYNETRVEQIIKRYRPDYIYHAAAYKHVPLMEDSPAEAIRTNVIGTYNVAKLADKYGVKKMVLVSTDKAVRPTNVMGATKRFAETIIQYYSSVSKNTKYAAVRFGNVLGSNGSVVPLFKKQIEAGGPVTITDKNIIRYFMTIPEAVSLILQCGLFAEGGEIFILDMGKPVKILSLAERLIRQAGLVPYEDIDIIETGLRPGEKLFEELLLDVEHQKKTSNKRIYVEEKEIINKNLENDVKESCKAFDMDETADIKKLLTSLIKTYTIDKK